MAVKEKGNLYHNLHIFADDCLRLDDNPSLLNALETSKTLHTVFFVPYTKRNALNHPPIHRLKFLIESLECLKTQLNRFGIPLYIINGPTITALRPLIIKWGITRVTMEKPTSYIGKRNCVALANILAANGVKLLTELSNTLYDITKIQPNIKQRLFRQITYKMPRKLPISAEKIRLLVDFKSACDPGVNTNVPDLKFFEVAEEKLLYIDSKFKGGELEAKEQLKKRITCVDGAISENFALSPALNFGCLSPRIIHDYILKHSVDPKTANKIYVGLTKRDYLILIGGQCANIDNQASIYNYILPWDQNAEHVKRFEAGKTGFPIVDAAIAQLKKEGFVSDRIRMILARFLTCGMIWLGWHHGVKLFYEWSLDYNPAICGLSWMLMACATWLQDDRDLGDVNPIEQAQAADPDGEYIKKYLPQLSKFPPEFVHTPWRAPLQLQMEIGSVIGENYPHPLYAEPEKRFIQCKNRLEAFYTIVKTAFRRESIQSLGKRKLDVKADKRNEKVKEE